MTIKIKAKKIFRGLFDECPSLPKLVLCIVFLALVLNDRPSVHHNYINASVVNL